MKKPFFTLILLLLAINSYSQLKHFFPDTNSYFSVSWMKFWFEGDTIFDNLKYKKVYMQWGDSIADFNRASYFSAIREDTVAEKVYFYYVGYGSPYEPETGEYLLYDFSVKVGEVASFYSLWCWWQPTLKEQTVKSIDSILIDNQYRKRINFFADYGGPPETWIEGIGSENGLFFPGYFDIVDAMDWTKLLCVHLNENIIYQMHEDCYRKEYGVNIGDNKQYTLKIYPTIVNKELYIETNNNIDRFDYKIINLQGQIVNEGMLTSNTLNIENLNKGFYLFVISDKKIKKNIKIQKFIKN